MVKRKVARIRPALGENEGGVWFGYRHHRPHVIKDKSVLKKLRFVTREIEKEYPEWEEDGQYYTAAIKVHLNKRASGFLLKQIKFACKEGNSTELDKEQLRAAVQEISEDELKDVYAVAKFLDAEFFVKEVETLFGRWTAADEKKYVADEAAQIAKIAEEDAVKENDKAEEVGKNKVVPEPADVVLESDGDGESGDDGAEDWESDDNDVIEDLESDDDVAKDVIESDNDVVQVDKDGESDDDAAEDLVSDDDIAEDSDPDDDVVQGNL